MSLSSSTERGVAVSATCLVWGAVDALAHRKDGSGQPQAFRIDYSGGWKSRHDLGYWRTFKNVCGRYDEPELPLLIAACKAPDGTYGALQAWQRKLPMRGFAPWTHAQKEHELHLSHRSGALPVPARSIATEPRGA